MALLEIQNLSFAYPEAKRKTLKDVSLIVEEGDFVVLCGSTGSGKTTLLHHLKNEIRPAGTRTGQILYQGEPLESISDPARLAEIGLVFQDPEQQFVMETVRQELAFGLENHGYAQEEIRKRIGELTSFFGLEEWLDRDVHQLSGGQKQWVNLASVLLLRPKLLLLDEPTSQLDPVSSRQFVQLLQRLGEEFSLTVIISEHRLEDLYPLAGRIVMMNEGKIVAHDDPRSLCYQIWESAETSRMHYIPNISKVYLTIAEGASGTEAANIPLTVNEGRRFAAREDIRKRFNNTARIDDRQPQSKQQLQQQPDKTQKLHKPSLTLHNVSFQYEKNGRQILDRISFHVPSNGMLAILGGNGAGKSTLLRVMLGLLQPQQGKVLFRDRPVDKLQERDKYRVIGYLDQNPMLYFTYDTVERSLKERLQRLGLHMTDSIVQSTMQALQWNESCLPQHPYDLSGGERQKTALLFTLLSDPEVLLLDEPTKGLDPDAKQFFGQFLQQWSEQKSVVLVSHDLEFAAEYASRFSMLFDGQLTDSEKADAFFSGNYYYTTSIHRVFGELVPGAIAYRDVMRVCRPGLNG